MGQSMDQSINHHQSMAAGYRILSLQPLVYLYVGVGPPQLYASCRTRWISLDAEGWHLVNLPEGTFTENLLELVLCIDLEPETHEQLNQSELNNPRFKQVLKSM